MGGSFKYIIPSIIGLILIVLVLENKFIPKDILGNVYNITEAETNFDSIGIGDSINFEINGYSDWQVIGKDEYEGTIDVVSKTNTEDLELQQNQTEESYQQLFQETANKYMDNNYVINVRTVNKDDLNFFEYTEDFWLSNINDKYISTAKTGEWNSSGQNYKIYVIPYMNIPVDNVNDYQVEEIIEYSNNGVDRWIVSDRYHSDNADYKGYITIIPEVPIELKIESLDDDIKAKAQQIFDSFVYIDKDGNQKKSDDYKSLYYSASWYNYPNLSDDQYYFYVHRGVYNDVSYYVEDGKIKASWILYNDNGQTRTLRNQTIFTDDSKTLGYRPVITLKVNKKATVNEISNDLKEGDYVKYEANGYNRWKVLSIDNNLGSVDIISSGIVKNITLSGKKDWNNYEDLIQTELDKYKNGKNAISASTISLSNLKKLNAVDRDLLIYLAMSESRYWMLSKSTYIRERNYLGGSMAQDICYGVSIVEASKKEDFEIRTRIITLHNMWEGEQSVINYYKLEQNDYTYTAGLRPVITLKLDSVEKLNEEETKKIEESTSRQEKVYIKEQESKNNDYKGPSTVDDSTSSKGDVIDDKSDASLVANDSSKSKEKIVYKDRPLYKYAFITFLTTSIIELIIIILLIRKIKQ